MKSICFKGADEKWRNALKVTREREINPGINSAISSVDLILTTRHDGFVHKLIFVPRTNVIHRPNQTKVSQPTK